jgi:hypothetical protein
MVEGSLTSLIRLSRAKLERAYDTLLEKLAVGV